MMKALAANLHPSRKSIFACVVAFIAAFLLISLAVSIAVGIDISQLDTLLHSKYEYSAVAHRSALENTYYRYNAGISFTKLADLKIRFNAEILMQTEEGNYSDMIFWNTTKLSGNGVAVSKNIADRHGLKIGDTIFSKHIVDGITRPYIIEKILPVATSARVMENGKHSDGIIVMGYDKQYAANISYSCIIFSNEPIEIAAEGCSEMPTDISYREDEIITVVIRILPYLLALILGAATLVVIATIFLSKTVAGNFKRLVSSGAGFGALNHAYYKTTIGIGMGLVTISVIISAISFGMMGSNLINAVPVLAAVIAESFALIATATISNKHLWRN